MPGLTNLGIGWRWPGDFVVRTNVTTLTDYSPRYPVIGYSLAL